MYDHLIQISAEGRILIYRVFGDGRRDFYTSVDVPDGSLGIDSAVFFEFSQKLGEVILIDSPNGRKALSL